MEVGGATRYLALRLPVHQHRGVSFPGGAGLPDRACGDRALSEGPRNAPAGGRRLLRPGGVRLLYPGV